MQIALAVRLCGAGALVPHVCRGVIAAAVGNRGETYAGDKDGIIGVDEAAASHIGGTVQRAGIPVFGGIEIALPEKVRGEQTAVLGARRKIDKSPDEGAEGGLPFPERGMTVVESAAGFGLVYVPAAAI